MRSTLLTLLIAALGAGVAHLVGAPAALLTGSALAVSLAGLWGGDLQIAPKLRDVSFLVIGIGIGSTVTPDTLSIVAQLPVAFAALFLLLVGMMICCQAALRHGFGYDPRTAVLAAAPGHLTFVIGLSAEAGGDALKVTVVQAVRLLALTLIVPVIAAGMGVTIAGNPLGSGSTLPLGQFAALLGVSAAVGLCLLRLKGPAALLIAAMCLSALAHGINLVQGGLHPVLGQVAFVVLGALLSTRFAGIGWRAVRSGLLAGVSVTVIASALALLAAVPVARLLGLHDATVLAAFAPGGFETMVALGAVLGANPGFVAAAHVARLMFLTGLIPWMLARATRRTRSGAV